MTSRAEELKNKGNRVFQDGQYDKAKKLYQDAVKAAIEEGADDIIHIIYGNLAHANNKLGVFKEAEKYGRLAIRKKPDWFKGYHRAAMAAKGLGKLDDAIALLDKGIDNCVINDELKNLRDSIVDQKKKPKGASKPPPPPPLLKANQPAATAWTDSKAKPDSKTKLGKASKATKASKASTATAGTGSENVGKGVWSGLLAASKPAETVSEQTAAAARAGQPDALNQELCIIVRRGSIALRRPGGAREAYDEYRRALQQVAKHPKELNLSGNELISLRYCFAMACHEVATQEALNAAEEELLAIIQKTKRPMPAAFYLLGMVYMRLNRFEQGATVLQMADAILSKDARGDTHVYPGTPEVIADTERAWRGTLRPEVQRLLRQCQYPPRADAWCRLEHCLSRVAVPDVRQAGRASQQIRRAIYYGDVDFAGFIQVQCLARCRLEFHLACWRQLKERFGPETQRTTDKDLLNTPCMTPDCDSPVCRIVTIDANGLEKHEIVSDELRKQQQKQTHKQLSKAQKKQAALAQKKHQQTKASRKHRDSAPQVEGEAEKPSVEPATPSGGTASADPAGAAAAAPEADPAPPPDLREMTVLRRGSATDEVPVGKKSKKKKKGPSTSRVRGWRPATEAFWEPPEVEEVYNGPPVNVIYTTSGEDLATRLCQLEEMRTLQFSTRTLIPDSSVQPASVPRDDESSEETHAILESAYQFLYDYLKGRGPTPADDPELLEAASDLPGYCQELIAQYGSLESFLTRLPRFYQMDNLLCVEVDVGMAEAMLGSAVSDRIQHTSEPTPPPPPAVPTPAAAAAAATATGATEDGVSDADTAELEPGSYDEDFDSESEDDLEGESETESEEVVDDGESTHNGAVQSSVDPSELDSGAGDAVSEAGYPGSEAGYPDSGTVDPDSTEPEPDSVGLDGDSEVGVEAAEAAEELEKDALAAGGGGARGDGAWNADQELSDGAEDSPSQSEPSDEAGSFEQLRQEIETLKREKSEQAEQLSEARLCQLRLERTVRQMSQRGGVSEPTDSAQRLVDARQQLAETQGRLALAEQQRLQLQQQFASAQHQLLGAQQQLAAQQTQQGQLEMQLAAMADEAQQYQAQLAETEQQLASQQQHSAVLEQQVEQMAAQLSQLSAVDPEELRQLKLQLEQEAEARRRAEAALDDLRAGERRTRGQYVTMLSKAGTAQLDAAARRCTDAISSAQRVATSSGRPDSALPAVSKLQEAMAALEQTRTQFKEIIKKACKAIASKETIDIQSLKLPEIPDIVETALTGPAAAARKPARSSPAGSVRSGASPRPSSRPSSVVTVSSGSGSETGKVSPSPTPPPPAAASVTAAGVRAPSPRRAVTPAALQLSAASRQAAPTTFDALVGEIERQFGGAVPGGREAIIREFTNYRRRRGGALRGAARDQIVSEVTAMIRAAAADLPSAPAGTAWGTAAKANGVQPAATPAPLASVPSKEECVICRENYSTSQARKLECGHQLHELCLRRWFKTNGVMGTCPICRHPFTSDTDFPSL